MGTGFIITTYTNYQVEQDWASSDTYLGGSLRVAMGYKTSSSLLSIPFTTTNGMVGSMWLKNTSDSTNVYIYYIK